MPNTFMDSTPNVSIPQQQDVGPAAAAADVAAAPNLGNVANAPSLSTAQPTAPAPVKVNPKHALLGSIFETLAGGARTEYSVDESGQMKANKVLLKPGEMFRGILAGALTGLAAGMGERGPAAGAKAFGAGFGATTAAAEERTKEAKQQAKEDFQRKQVVDEATARKQERAMRQQQLMYEGLRVEIDQKNLGLNLEKHNWEGIAVAQRQALDYDEQIARERKAGAERVNGPDGKPLEWGSSEEAWNYAARHQEILHIGDRSFAARPHYNPVDKKWYIAKYDETPIDADINMRDGTIRHVTRRPKEEIADMQEQEDKARSESQRRTLTDVEIKKARIDLKKGEQELEASTSWTAYIKAEAIGDFSSKYVSDTQRGVLIDNANKSSDIAEKMIKSLETAANPDLEEINRLKARVVANGQIYDNLRGTGKIMPKTPLGGSPPMGEKGSGYEIPAGIDRNKISDAFRDRGLEDQMNIPNRNKVTDALDNIPTVAGRRDYISKMAAADEVKNLFRDVALAATPAKDLESTPLYQKSLALLDKTSPEQRAAMIETSGVPAPIQTALKKHYLLE